MIEPMFIKEWPEDTPIAWWNAGRKRLNEVIRRYNAWQRDGVSTGRFDPIVANQVLALVAEGRQTWAAVDGGGAWVEALDQIEKLVHDTGIA